MDEIDFCVHAVPAKRRTVDLLLVLLAVRFLHEPCECRLAMGSYVRFRGYNALLAHDEEGERHRHKLFSCMRRSIPTYKIAAFKHLDWNTWHEVQGWCDRDSLSTVFLCLCLYLYLCLCLCLYACLYLVFGNDVI
jgi:hypothetical protein